jgi:hypothetical protein
MCTRWLVMTTSILASLARAASAAGPSDAHADAILDAAPHPVLTSNGEWAGTMVLVIFGVFLCALGAGLAHLNMDPDLPPTHSHDQPLGTSGRHANDETRHAADTPMPTGH